MKNVLFILALALSAGLNIYLYQRFTAADTARRVAEQHFADCEQVTFQLQNQLSQEERGGPVVAPGSTAPAPKRSSSGGQK